MGLRVLHLSDVVNRHVIEWLRRMVLSDPATHGYVLYDIVYWPANTCLSIVVDDVVVGYVLEWRGRGCYAIHLWGTGIPVELIRGALRRGIGAGTIYIHIHSRGIEPVVIEIAEEIYGRYDREVFVDMVADRKRFRPYYLEQSSVYARILDAANDLREFTEFLRRRGIEASYDDARSILEENVYAGVFENNRLVSTAAAIVRLRDAWIIADVYTLPGHRGRGYAKLATSTITSLGLSAGAKKIALHVNSQNTIAIRVYKRLGYQETSRKTWIIVKSNKHRSTN